MSSVSKRDHHVSTGKCLTRPKYRQGRKDTAVKVFTVSQESYYILIQNVPSLGVENELQALCQKFGSVEKCERLPDYPSEEFTETFLAKYTRLQEARTAKKELDERSFFGSTLNVCFAPELETLAMTRQKLQERRKMVSARLHQFENPGGTKKIVKAEKAFFKSDANDRQNKPATETNNHASGSTSGQPETVTYVWAGEEYTVPVVPLDSPVPKPFRTLVKDKTAGFTPRQLAVPKMVAPSTDESKATFSYEETRKRIRSRLDAMKTRNPDVVLAKRRKKNS